ncbi:hypothetical protein [Flavobacterium sp.]|uniref:hypothetical protein n=1 Tax=Flavobacterium sp. TaxID=239 RepID=UPI003D2BE8CC
MKKIVFFILFGLASFTSNAQDMSCTELMEFIEDEGSYYSNVSNFTMNSSWLYKVTCYSYDYKYYVIAEIKENEYSYSTKKYVFCNIPYSNWRDFKNGDIFNKSTHGERFHKYIKDYLCNCY